MNRISREKMLMEIALVVEKRSTCNRGSSGAIISRDGRIIATGYNGPVRFAHHCSPQFCDTTKPCVRSVHAEANALIFAARHGISVEGASLYCTTSPCSHICAPLIINSGISRVIYLREFRDISGIEALKMSGIMVVKHDI